VITVIKYATLLQFVPRSIDP